MRYLWLMIFLVLSACATTSDENIQYYQPIVSDQNAAIVGTRISKSFPSNDQTAFVIGVDGAFVKGGQSQYAQSIPLSIGAHTVTVVWVQGRLFGQTLFRVDAKSNAKYVIKHQATDENIVRIWIEDRATIQPISEPVLIKVSAMGNVRFQPFFSHSPR